MRTEGQHKARKGLIKVSVDEEGGIIQRAVISGDFFLYPEDSLWLLEKELVGMKLIRKELLAKVNDFYKEMGVFSPGVTPEDFVEALLKAT